MLAAFQSVMGFPTFNLSLVEEFVGRVLSPHLAEVVPRLGGVGFASHEIEEGRVFPSPR